VSRRAGAPGRPLALEDRRLRNQGGTEWSSPSSYRARPRMPPFPDLRPMENSHWVEVRAAHRGGFPGRVPRPKRERTPGGPRGTSSQTQSAMRRRMVCTRPTTPAFVKQRARSARGATLALDEQQASGNELEPRALPAQCDRQRGGGAVVVRGAQLRDTYALDREPRKKTICRRFRACSSVRSICLKTVVSPVRVRVSPFQAGNSPWCFSRVTRPRTARWGRVSALSVSCEGWTIRANDTAISFLSPIS